MTVTTDFSYEAAPSQPKYSYYITDLRTNEIIGELDFQNVSYSTVLSGIGDFSGTLSVNRDTLSFTKTMSGDGSTNPMIDRSFPTMSLREITTPGRCGIYVFRNEKPVWGGILWKRQFNASDGKINITGKTFESYFYHRFQRTTKYWSNEDQLEIARWLVTSNGSAAALHIDVDTATSPRYRERTMFGYEFKTTGEELEQLANLIDGFDWNVIIGLDSIQNPTRKLTFYYPEAGVTREKTSLLFEFPGVIKNFTMTDDSESGGNFIWAIGAGEGTEMVIESASDYGQLAEGWPMLEASRSYKSVLRPSTLQGHATAGLNKLNSPITVFEVEIRGDLDPLFGTYSLGDWARFRFKHLYFYEKGTNTAPYFNEWTGEWEENGVVIVYDEPMYDRMARITGIKVSVDNNSGVETINLDLGGDELAGDE